MPSHRIKQINELIRRELDTILAREFDFPVGILVSISAVETTPDLGCTTVMVSVIPAPRRDSIVALLTKRAGWVQHRLGAKLVLYKIPELKFIADIREQRASRIDQLIDKIHRTS